MGNSRFVGFNNEELLILWAAIERASDSWERNPQLLPNPYYYYLGFLKAELHTAWLENNFIPSKGGDEEEENEER